MTVGKDVSALFPDVANCMQTDNLELKKLVYLYLMNYAKSQPDMAIMAVNTFVKDCEDPNPLIRALAVRTMGCIRVDKVSILQAVIVQLALRRKLFKIKANLRNANSSQRVPNMQTCTRYLKLAKAKVQKIPGAY